jgi:hypothetical protein
MTPDNGQQKKDKTRGAVVLFDVVSFIVKGE